MIEDYRFGRVVVSGETYTSDVIIFPDHVRADWWRRKGHELCREDIAQIVAARPEIVVVGTGAYGRVEVLPDAEEALAAIGTKIIAERTARACDTFNALVGEGRYVVAALHLTC